jgi:hypothetical protein
MNKNISMDKKAEIRFLLLLFCSLGVIVYGRVANPAQNPLDLEDWYFFVGGFLLLVTNSGDLKVPDTRLLSMSPGYQSIKSANK